MTFTFMIFTYMLPTDWPHPDPNEWGCRWLQQDRKISHSRWGYFVSSFFFVINFAFVHWYFMWQGWLKIQCYFLFSSSTFFFIITLPLFTFTFIIQLVLFLYLMCVFFFFFKLYDLYFLNSLSHLKTFLSILFLFIHPPHFSCLSFLPQGGWTS